MEEVESTNYFFTQKNISTIQQNKLVLNNFNEV